jgi:exonuclease SbcC
MANINKLVIEGFQSHEYSELTFDRGLNVILGASDQGKSAVIRALRWVLFNEPRGADFIRTGSTLCRVRVALDNGWTIVRERNQSGSRNRYLLIDPQGRESVFEGFSHQGVPEEVMRAHGMMRFVLDEGEQRILNIGQQLEGPFLLSESGTIRAKAIGRLAGVHILDRAQRGVQRDIHRLQGETKRIQEQKREIAEAMRSFDDLPQQKAILDRLLIIGGEIAGSNQKLSVLKRLKNRLEQVGEEIRQGSQRLVQLQVLSPIAEKLAETDRLLVEYNTLSRVYNRWLSNRQGIESSNTRLRQLDQLVDMDRIMDQVQQNRKKLERLTVLKNQLDQVERTKLNVRDVLAKTEQLEQQEQRLELVNQMREKGNQLAVLRKKLVHIRREIGSAAALLQHLSALERVEAGLEGVVPRLKQRDRLLQASAALAALREHIKNARLTYNRHQEMLERLVTRYQEVLRHAGRCPTCFSRIDDEVVRQIINTLKGSDGNERFIRTAN